MKKFILFIAFISFNLFGLTNNKNYYKNLDSDISLFFTVLKGLNNLYVDTINTHEFVQKGLKSMLSSLDPYTNLLEKNESQQYTDLTSGKYCGIGVYVDINKKDNVLMIISPIDNTPASKAGLRAGDEIIKIDSISTYGFKISDASKYLRGREGEEVELTIKRANLKNPFTITLKRALIPTITVPYAGIVGDGVFYIRLSQFSAKSEFEIREKLGNTPKDQIKSIILDVRSNPGGLLSAAVNISNLFLEENNVIVSTKGVNGYEEVYKTLVEPLLPNVPLAILINGSSASASEILSGALQDYDRAVVIGTNSYGKGLVQQIYPITNNFNLKITIAKYYTPSGRLIQKINYFNHNSKKVMNDTLSYTTKNGRMVKSGSGILPDIIVDNEKSSPYISFLLSNNEFFSFVRQYFGVNKKSEYTGINKNIMNKFRTYLDTSYIKFEPLGQIEVDSLVSYCKQNKLNKLLLSQIKEISKTISNSNETIFKDNYDTIFNNLEIIFAIYINGNSEKYKLRIKNDSTIKKAIEILGDTNKYEEILNIN